MGHLTTELTKKTGKERIRLAAILIRLLFIFLAFYQAGCSVTVQKVPTEYDIVVYGGTSSAVAAALQAARMGKTVVLIQPGRHLGGLTSGGLGATDIGNKDAIGGIAREFYQRVYRHYTKDDAWIYESSPQYEPAKRWEGTNSWWLFEPHVAAQTLTEMVRQANVQVIYGQRLDLKKGVRKDGSRITAIVTESGQVFAARMFIDATYEGDLMAKAGVSYFVGREANSQYGETLNGVQTANARYHQFDKCVDPYVRAGDKSSGLLPGVHGRGPGRQGQADHRLQAYNYRMCLTDVTANKMPFPKPKDYDELRYELLLRYYEAGYDRIGWLPVQLPNRKTDTNNRDGFSTDNIAANYGYADGDYAARKKIIRDHISYQKGLMWTLANHRRVPEKIRGQVSRWGLAKDEFVDNDNWPHQIYVREARRMVSDYIMTEQNCRGRRIAEDPVGLAAYGMDSHNTQRYVDENGCVRNEGDIQVGGFSPYPISYRSIIPRHGECSNLLVPVCVSASHIAFGSIRMEPVFMILAQSAATAACLAIDENVGVQQLDYRKLRSRLLQDGQILQWKQ